MTSWARRSSRPFPSSTSRASGRATLRSRRWSANCARATWTLPGLSPACSSGDATARSPTAGTSLPPADLDQLPIPDYDDYLSTLAARAVSPDGSVVVPVETSRGCPWSVRGGCRFCGIVGPYKSYRTKSAERILEELRVLAAVPGCRRVDVVDNVAAPALLTDRAAAIGAGPPGGSPVHRHQAGDRPPHGGSPGRDRHGGPDRHRERQRRAAHPDEQGVLRSRARASPQVGQGAGRARPVEPASRVPRRDGRGLRGTHEHVLQAITHLDAPRHVCNRGGGAVQFLSSKTPRRSGSLNVRPAAAYRYIFPFDDATLGDIAYFFDHDFAPGREPYDGSFELRRFVYNWQRARAHDVSCCLRAGRERRESTPAARGTARSTASTRSSARCSRRATTSAPGLRLEAEVRRSGIDGDGLAHGSMPRSTGSSSTA